MKKSYGWLRYGVQTALIIIAAAALAASHRSFAGPVAFSGEAHLALVILIVFGAVTVILNILFDRRDFRLIRHEREEDILALQEKAQTDALTGLLNREAAIEQITQFLKAEGRLHSHTLLIVDLDNFKSINDSFGHFEGDKVLKTLAAKIRDVFRSGDIVGRLGGDEFIILMKRTVPGTAVCGKARQLQAALEYITSGGGVSVTVTGSIGIAFYNGDGKAFETLYKEADEALYKAKLSGKNRYRCYGGAEEAHPGGDQPDPALCESSATIQLQALIDNIDGGIMLLEAGSELRAIFLSHSFVNQMNLSYSGIKQADNRIFDLIHQDDIAPVEAQLRQGAASWKPVEAVFRRQKDNGRISWYHLRAVRIQYESSPYPVLLAIVTDVTNLKETALNYQAQKKQLETVLRISRVVTFEVDIASRTLTVTDPTVVKYGIDTHVIENMPEALIAGGAIHPDSVDECRRMYEEIYAGVPEGSAVIRTLKRDGQYTIERFTYFMVFDESGRPVKAVGVDESLEMRSDTRMRVELLERQFRFHSDSMLLVVKVTLRDDSYTLLKADASGLEEAAKARTFTEFLELVLGKVVGGDVRGYLRRTYGVSGLQKSFNEGKAILSDEYFVGGPAGAIYCHAITAGQYVSQMDGDVYAFIRVRDVTRRKQLEEELQVTPERDPKTLLYYPEALRRMADALALKEDRALPYAVVLLSMDNYETMLELYGSLMMNELLVGFYGKIKMIVYSEHFVSHDGKGTMLILIPEVYSGAWLRQLMEKTIRLLKNPAFFQRHEEQFAEYRCGVAVSGDGAVPFDRLSAGALEALHAADGVNDIKFWKADAPI
ncbi:diguanylate cyclase (GGDEF) domain-containing protein [Sporobacter termitidis DSM 10068]|uniref:Diguanylate cyclase (GGDEF) domain-containing protein n=1 Tax=Sporobacter termitidis DSM 10068 TaxID=1123282 RepID=A0A1M5YVW1_9FIRM|nr:diguanylate cyclase [Sporobacter termitidis]SHI15978.1 diguanylate cyclase (GGDEF) domain-containing protein [Sporobacter termitidis DSM 10068]